MQEENKEDNHQIDENLRWKDLYSLLLKDSPFKNPVFEASEKQKDLFFKYCKILVVGAGGLGCEILKDLALSGVKDIHVIDLDTIDLTNLNRQFLFRFKDVGKYKCDVAAKFVMDRVKGCKVTPHVGKIQDKDRAFYEQFFIIIAGLDNIEARRWLNSLVHSMVKFDEKGQPLQYTQKILIDGGTEGFKGQARVIVPFKTACYECTLNTIPTDTKFNFCTIAHTPRIPEHTIAYAYLIQWKEHFGDKKIDTDSFDDMNWIFQQAKIRAEQYKISGVNYMMTMGVVKNIIPAIASTNAIIAACCANEVLKLFTGCSLTVDNYFQYLGHSSINTHTFQYEKLNDCLVCSGQPKSITISKKLLLKDLVNMMKEKPYELKDPSMLTEANKHLIHPIVHDEEEAAKLEKSFEQLEKEDLYVEGQIIYLTDIKLTTQIKISLSFSK